jgi:predicted nucleic acid-binding Zn ribbon protein
MRPREDWPAVDLENHWGEAMNKANCCDPDAENVPCVVCRDDVFNCETGFAIGEHWFCGDECWEVWEEKKRKRLAKSLLEMLR